MDQPPIGSTEAQSRGPREGNVTPAAGLVVLPQYELVPKLEFVSYYY